MRSRSLAMRSAAMIWRRSKAIGCRRAIITHRLLLDLLLERVDRLVLR